METYEFLKDFGLIGFVILQIIFVSVVGWLIASLRAFKELVDKDLKSLDKRLTRLEKDTAIDVNNLSHYHTQLDQINKKLDLILNPDFFKSCPKMHQ